MTLPKSKSVSSRRSKKRKVTSNTFQSLRLLSQDMPQAVQVIVAGLHPNVLGVLATGYAVPQHLIQGVVNVSDGTLDRRRKAGSLNDTESDTVLRLAGLFDYAATVLGGDEQAQRWLTRKQYVLGDVAPLELAKTSVGSDYVRSVLNAVEYGLPS
jgi:putative toxin-antitoxin system antitoxin component (TIGR02293 family)